ncbi:MAG: hypothetical protein SCALA701_35030 [Candidatus Scalindua sp.]|nr:MAG: hypothetical protein SCALA701_35030 [Candidatus Scalindua sp.]
MQATDEVYIKERKLLQSQLASFKQNLRESEDRAVNWFSKADTYVFFARGNLFLEPEKLIDLNSSHSKYIQR